MFAKMVGWGEGLVVFCIIYLNFDHIMSRIFILSTKNSLRGCLNTAVSSAIYDYISP